MPVFFSILGVRCDLKKLKLVLFSYKLHYFQQLQKSSMQIILIELGNFQQALPTWIYFCKFDPHRPFILFAMKLDTVLSANI